MADYPTPSEYQEVLQVPSSAFRDPELQGAVPRTNVLGLPQPLTGAFASVFPLTTDTGKEYAVKCFLKEIPKQEARYEAVASYLQDVELEAFVSFDYQPQGIRVEEGEYPLLKMEWVDGTPLNRLVREHLDASQILAQVAEAWEALMRELESRDLAHGDLQHGNVLVQRKNEDVQLRLVDYDTMYVPALEGWNSAEIGHRNYQHPDRTDSDFGPYLDRFPGLVIYTALRACAARPSLWERYATGENLLFRDRDFYDPEQSALFDELSAMESVAALADALRTACYVEPSDVPPLPDVRAGRLDPADVSLARTRRRRRRSKRDRGLFARYFLPAVGVFLLITAGSAAVGFPWGALGIGGGGALIGGAWVARRYRRLSLVRRRRRLEQEQARFTEAIRGLEREVERLQEKRAELFDSIDERRAERLDELQEEALSDHLKHHFIGEIREVEGLVHKHVVRLKAANIRNAYEATPDTLEGVRRISDEARARINMWRAALVQKYEHEIPDALSPAQERRLRRYIDHRIENLDETLARTEEKIQVQKTERARIQDRLEEMPTLSVWTYLTYLFRLGALPVHSEGSPVPSGESNSQKPSTPDPLPEPVSSDRDWWQRS